MYMKIQKREHFKLFKAFIERCRNDFWFTRKAIAIIGTIAAIIVIIIRWQGSTVYIISAVFFVLSAFALILGIILQDYWPSIYPALYKKPRLLSRIANKLHQSNKNGLLYKVLYCKESIGYKILYHLSSIITVVFVILALWSLIITKPEYHVDPVVSLVWGIMYSVDFCFFQHRWTYRVLPNLFLSGAILILFMLIISASMGGATILGFGIMNESRIAFFLGDSFTKWLGWGAIGAILSALIGKATGDVWYGMGRISTGESSQLNYRFKHQRRKLLAYKGTHFTKLGSMQLCFACIIPTVGTIVFFSKDGDIRKFLGQLYLISVALTIFGVLLYQFITDENLLRSENDYIKDRRQAAEDSWGNYEAKASPCRKAAWEWTCYCQVVANIFCSRSPVRHENEVYHRLNILEKTGEGDLLGICPMRVVSDILCTFDEQFKLYCSAEAKQEQYRIELQLADMITRFINHSIKRTRIPTWSDNTFILETINQEFDVFFKEAEDIISVVGVPIEDAKKLLVIDFIKWLSNKYIDVGKTCGECSFASWCHDTEASKMGSHAVLLKRRKEQAELFRQLFPYYAVDLLIDRWTAEKLVPGISGNTTSPIDIIISRYEAAWAEDNGLWAKLTEKAKLNISEWKKNWKTSHSAWLTNVGNGEK